MLRILHFPRLNAWTPIFLLFTNLSPQKAILSTQHKRFLWLNTVICTRETIRLFKIADIVLLLGEALISGCYAILSGWRKCSLVGKFFEDWIFKGLFQTLLFLSRVSICLWSFQKLNIWIFNISTFFSIWKPKITLLLSSLYKAFLILEHFSNKNKASTHLFRFYLRKICVFFRK